MSSLLTTGPNPLLGPRSARRNELFYQDRAIFQAGDELFDIPTACLADQSQTFAELYLTNRGTKGRTDENPIVLDGCEAQEFESLLKVLLDRPVLTSPRTLTLPTLFKAEWMSALKLANLWRMHTVRKLAIEELSGMYLAPVEQITMARELKVARWLSEGALDVATNISSYRMEELGVALGWETTARLFGALHKIRVKRGEPLYDITRLECLGCNQRFTKIFAGYPTCTAGCTSPFLIRRKGFRSGPLNIDLTGVEFVCHKCRTTVNGDTSHCTSPRCSSNEFEMCTPKDQHAEFSLAGYPRPSSAVIEALFADEINELNSHWSSPSV